MTNPLRRIASVLILCSVATFASHAQPAASLRLKALRVEYAENPLGIDARKPRLSWQLASNARGVVQSAYQVRVAGNEADVRAGTRLMWDSGRVNSDESAHVEYGGPALRSGQRYVWQVRVWDGAGGASNWSDPAWWEMGLLDAPDWRATWIESAAEKIAPRESTNQPAHSADNGFVPEMFRHEFQLRGEVARARAYVTSHGLYELHLNGRRVSDDVFTPGWTSYNKRLQYQTYDVTALLKKGANAVGAIVGDGWYRFRGRTVYGDHLGLLLQIEVQYRDGSEETIATDASWKSSTGAILASDIYDGESYDARLEKSGWSEPGFADAQWAAVRSASYAKNILVAPAGPPVRRHEELRPIRIFKTPAGDTVADLGQNMVGWVRLKAQGPAGTTITLRHAEVLDKQGNFYTENLRKAAATDHYTLRGGGAETYEPHFTFHGFRYVAVSGYPGELTPESVTGIVVHSDIAPAGTFETSKAAINQLQHNIVWGQKGNFVDVPTDCPQRDERLGWTGDAEVFAPTAAFNRDVAGFFTKWLRDLAADQAANGAVPHVIPNAMIIREWSGGAAGWADSATIVPWDMYLAYGDKRILEQQYPSMQKWVEYERQRAGDDFIWDGDPHFGDWLAYAAPPSEATHYPGATTGTDLIATAYFAYSTDLLRRTAEVLGKGDDAARYAAQLEKIKAAFVHEFVTATARVGEGTQTAYVLALQLDLLPEEMRPIAARRLVQDVRAHKHLTTGFLGTPFLTPVLTRYGYLDEAYMLLNREQYPSWLYPVKQGATTIWERWDGQKPDGTFQDAGMNSFNHYAYGAIGEWMYGTMAGIEIDPREPGYKHVVIAPRPGGGFTSVKATHETMYGTVASAWRSDGGNFELSIEVPANTHATVRLPKAQLAAVTESGAPPANGNGMRGSRQDGDAVVVEVGSGQYRFAYPIAAK